MIRRISNFVGSLYSVVGDLGRVNFCKDFWDSYWVRKKLANWRILGYIFCVISIDLSNHYLMKLIKWNFWILKEHNNFSYLLKFEPDISDSFGQTVFEKCQNLQRMYKLINLLPPSSFAVFNSCFFSLLLIANSWLLHKLHKLTSSFNFWTKLLYTAKSSVGSITRMLMSRNINNDVTMNPPLVDRCVARNDLRSLCES